MGLRVIEQFEDFKVGDLIPDGEKADAILRSEQASFVVRVSDEEPEEKSEDLPRVYVTDKK